MSTAPTYAFDLESLLTPIAGERRAGESLRYDGTYDRIRQARREDDSRLNQGIYQVELKRADWAEVEAICLEALATRSKDLQIAAWLLEAWLHRYGFAGAREGLRLLAALCESFWEDLYPSLEEGGELGGRVAPFEWVNEKLSVQLKHVPVTAPQGADAAAYSYADWESACDLDTLSHKDQKAAQAAEARGRVSISKFSSSLMLTDARFFAALNEVLGGAIETCAALESLLDEKCGREAPSLHGFREALLAVRRLAADVLRSRPEAIEYPAAEEEALQYEDEPEDEGGRLWPSAPIRSRAEAYRRLAEAADYLLRTEPHSPTPYLVLRAVEWGGMSLQEVLQQIVRNDGEMQEINRLLRLTGVGGTAK
ncbi:MAG: type secretion system protein ImpA [Acidobacteriota bacterium]|jgi:type VI secretion system ImpA family protein|nr:type secretion system protein ImpA [Acidobacteriota bacterium]